MIHIYVNIFEDKVDFHIMEYGKREKYKIILPISFSIGDKLSYIKKIISVIIEQYNIETYSMEIDKDIGIGIIEAVKMEGVLEELFSCKGVMLWK